VELVQELGRRMTAVTGDTREATYLFQWIGMLISFFPNIDYRFEKHFKNTVKSTEPIDCLKLFECSMLNVIL